MTKTRLLVSTIQFFIGAPPELKTFLNVAFTILYMAHHLLPLKAEGLVVTHHKVDTTSYFFKKYERPLFFHTGRRIVIPRNVVLPAPLSVAL
jgi:hypothetical protein